MGGLTKWQPLHAVSILALLFGGCTASIDSITPTQPLSYDQTLVSAGGTFALGFFQPGSSGARYIGIWYNNIPGQTVIWVANRQTPVTTSNASLAITADGSLSIIYANGTAYVTLASAPGLITNPMAQLLDTGNFVFTAGGGLLWQSFDHPTDTLLPGMKLGFDFRAGLNRNLTAWKRDDDPSPSNFTLNMDPRGDPQLTLWSGSVREWRSGPWTGNQFAGVPETRTYSTFIFNYVNNKTELYYSYDLTDKSIITRLLVNQSGATQRFVWLDGPGMWSLFYYTPKSPCDGYAPCGPYATCDSNDSPMCSCLPGFTPRSPKDWVLRDGSAGCVRKTPFDCWNGTDGFTKLSNALLPDTAVNVTVDMTTGLDECSALCLRNCSCTGYANADVRNGGSGCIMWATELTDIQVYTNAGQDLYIRLAAADVDEDDNGKSDYARLRTKVAVTVCFSFLFLLTCHCLRQMKKQQDKAKNASRENLSLLDPGYGNRATELSQFSYDTVVAATSNFSAMYKLGSGGFGHVYKGILADGQEVAVKRLSSGSGQGLQEFKNEVKLIGRLQHTNLARLIGFCTKGREKMLIYEYMPNKSLDTLLFDPTKSRALNWTKRMQIIEGIAQGLLYLHKYSRLRVIHRDLKAGNVLLDAELNPKISDFGLARIFRKDQIQGNTKRIVGTFGYMPPEYALQGYFSEKSDIFSFGVLLLEIVSGKRNTSFARIGDSWSLPGYVWDLWEKDRALELVDPVLDGEFLIDEILRSVKVGLLCVQERPKDRPNMTTIISFLNREVASIPSPKQPAFCVVKSSAKLDEDSNRRSVEASNEVTDSLEAR